MDVDCTYIRYIINKVYHRNNQKSSFCHRDDYLKQKFNSSFWHLQHLPFIAKISLFCIFWRLSARKKRIFLIYLEEKFSSIDKLTRKFVKKQRAYAVYASITNFNIWYADILNAKRSVIIEICQGKFLY